MRRVQAPVSGPADQRVGIKRVMTHGKGILLAGGDRNRGMAGFYNADADLYLGGRSPKLGPTPFPAVF